MSKWGGVAILANVIAHGWSLLVLFGNAKVLANVVLLAEADAFAMLGLDAVALLFTVLFAVFGRRRVSAVPA